MRELSSKEKELANFISAYFCDESYEDAITGIKSLIASYEDFLVETKHKFDAVMKEGIELQVAYRIVVNEADLFVKDEVDAAVFLERVYRDLFAT